MNPISALAIDAATERLCLAACRGARIACLERTPAREETASVYRHAERLLAEVEANYEGLDFVAFGCGPGSFTGVRVAASVAQALGYALCIPVCRISSLAVLAATASHLPGLRLAGVCLDARMGRAYVGLYDVSEGDLIAPVMPDAWVEPGSFELPGREPFAAIGSGWLAHPHLLERHRGRIAHVDPDLLPSSRDLMDFALREFDAGNVVAAEAALPEYLGQQPALPGVQSSRQEN